MIPTDLQMNVLWAGVLGCLVTAAVIVLIDFRKLCWETVRDWWLGDPSVGLGERLCVGVWLTALGIASSTSWRLIDAVRTDQPWTPHASGWLSFCILIFSLSMSTIGYFLHGVAASGGRKDGTHPIKSAIMIMIGGYISAFVSWLLIAHPQDWPW